MKAIDEENRNTKKSVRSTSEVQKASTEKHAIITCTYSTKATFRSGASIPKRRRRHDPAVKSTETVSRCATYAVQRKPKTSYLVTLLVFMTVRLRNSCEEIPAARRIHIGIMAVAPSPIFPHFNFVLSSLSSFRVSL